MVVYSTHGKPSQKMFGNAFSILGRGFLWLPKINFAVVSYHFEMVDYLYLNIVGCVD